LAGSTREALLRHEQRGYRSPQHRAPCDHADCTEHQSKPAADRERERRVAAGAGQKLEEGPEELGHRRKLRSQQLGLGVAGRPPGSRKFWDGDRGRRPEVPAARPGRPGIHRGHAKRRTAERSRRVAGCKGRPREPAARLSGDHRPGRFRSIGQDGANTRDEAWRGRFWRRSGKAWPC